MTKQKRRRNQRKKGGLSLFFPVTVSLSCLLYLIMMRPYVDLALGEGAYSEQRSTSEEAMVSAFIERMGMQAQPIARQHDLYASVMIAQALLESDSGQASLSQAPHYNFFGIKGSYKGQSVTMQTWEDDGNGNSYTIEAQFRSYGTPLAALEDYADLLDQDLYAGVHRSQTFSYQEATAALTGTYATDTLYHTKLNQLIETYGLTAYDSW